VNVYSIKGSSYEFYNLILAPDIREVEYKTENNGVGSYLGMRIKREDLPGVRSRLFEENVYETCKSLKQIGWRVNIIVHQAKRKKYIAIICWRRYEECNALITQPPCILTPAVVDSSVISYNEGKRSLQIVPSKYYKKNKIAFIQSGMSQILQIFLKNSVSESTIETPELAFASELSTDPYLFSTDQEIRLSEGKVFNIQGSSDSVTEYYAHVLNSYGGRVLWVGSLPEDPRYSNIFKIDVADLRFNFIGNHQIIDSSPLIDLMSNIVESVAKVRIRPGILRTILSEISGRGILKNKSFAERMYNIRDNKESHGTRDDFGQLVSVLFDGFDHLSTLNATQGHDISHDLVWKRHLLDVENRNDIFLLLGFLLFFTKNQGYPYDLVVVNDPFLAHSMSKSTYRDRFPPIFEQLQSISPNSRFLVHTKGDSVDVLLDLGGEYTKDAILRIEGNSYKVTVDNTDEMAAYIPELVTDIEISEPMAKVEDYLHDFDEFYKLNIEAFPESQLIPEDINDFQNRFNEESNIIAILMQLKKNDGDFNSLDMIREDNFRLTLGAMKNRGLVSEQKIGLSDSSIMNFLTPLGENYIDSQKSKILSFYSTFETDIDEIGKYIRKLKYGTVVGDNPADFHSDLSNVFLNLHIETAWRIVKNLEIVPLALALSSLWNPKLTFKDTMKGNGIITSIRITSLIRGNDLSFKDVQSLDIEVEGSEETTEVNRILPSNIMHGSDSARSIFDQEGGRVDDEYVLDTPNSELNDSPPISECELETIRSPTQISNTDEDQVDEKDREEIVKSVTESSEESVDPSELDETSHPFSSGEDLSNDEIQEKTQLEDEESHEVLIDSLLEGTEDPVDPKSIKFDTVKSENKSQWNYYKHLPGIEIPDGKTPLNSAILRLPLFRIAEGSLGDRLFHKATNLTLGLYQQLKDNIDFRRELGLSNSQMSALKKFDIRESGLNIKSLLPNLDDYSRYILALLGCKIPSWPKNTIELMDSEDQKKIIAMIDSTDEPMNYILPLVDKLFMEWSRMLIDREESISKRLEGKVSMLKSRMGIWKSSRVNVTKLELKNYALINNIIMLFQEILGGLFTEDVNKEILLSNIPEKLLRSLLSSSNRIHHIITFHLGYIYRLMKKISDNSSDSELVSELKTEIINLVPRVILRKY